MRRVARGGSDLEQHAPEGIARPVSRIGRPGEEDHPAEAEPEAEHAEPAELGVEDEPSAERDEQGDEAREEATPSTRRSRPCRRHGLQQVADGERAGPEPRHERRAQFRPRSGSQREGQQTEQREPEAQHDHRERRERIERRLRGDIAAAPDGDHQEQERMRDQRRGALGHRGEDHSRSGPCAAQRKGRRRPRLRVGRGPSKIRRSHMNSNDLLSALETRGTAQNRRMFARHGVRPPLFGVSQAQLSALAKPIGIDDLLACELWASGIHDARMLATRIADPARTRRPRVEAWIKDLDDHLLSDALARLVSGSPDAAAIRETARSRTSSPRPSPGTSSRPRPVPPKGSTTPNWNGASQRSPPGSTSARIARVTR